MDKSQFWEGEEIVDRFAAREPDKRLLSIIERYDEPSRIRVLDLGCAGGRNAEPLAEQGFDIVAVDMSKAMVMHTRDRVASVLGRREADRRVLVGRMEDLSRLYHSATTREQWDDALSETARVLKAGGLLLVAVFSPRTDPKGEGITRVSGEQHLYDGLHSGRHYLVEPDALDAAMAERGIEPVEPTRSVVVPLETGQRVTVNGLYRKGL
jgi:SAM-dependent methyltransferase